VHTEALRRFDFDSVLTPVSYRLATDAAYRHDLDELFAAAARTDAAVMGIKAIARRNWTDDEPRRYDTWYLPLDRQRQVTAAVAWVLGTFTQLTGIATAGETRLLRAMVEAERACTHITPSEAAEVLDRVRDYSSPFVSMPF
jgi:hypothetical protein